MSTGNCNTKNPLVRDGTSQSGRYIDALDPDFVKMDERSLTDQLQLLLRYARLVQYYNERNEADGNWTVFFNSGVASLVAMISGFPQGEAMQSFVQLSGEVRDPGSNNTDIRRAYKSIFDLIFTLLRTIENWHIKASDDTLLRRELRRHISSSLRGVFAEALSYYKEAQKNPKLADVSYFNAGHTPSPTLNTADLIEQEFSAVWSLNTVLSWPDYVNSIIADNSIFQPYRSNIAKATNKGLNRLQKLLEKTLAVYQQLQESSDNLMNDLLENYPGHQPHMSLMLTFFQLLNHARAEMNKLTGGHLDFYYKEVLQLSLMPAVPDTLHLILELAKHVEEALVKAGTEVKSGKDQLGVERIYLTDTELVANRAKVAQLKSVFISAAPGKKVYAAGVTNSLDGAGKEFEEDNPKWKAFGRDQNELAPEERTMSDARAGFAISSYDLFLQQGDREILITIDCKSAPKPSAVNLLKQGLQCRLTVEEEWAVFKPQYSEASKDILDQTGNRVQIKGKQLLIKLVLSKEDPPVIAYNTDVHGIGYSVNTPIVEVLATDGTEGNCYELLSALEPTTVTVNTKVSGFKDVLLQNDNTSINPSKPFEPFGAQPKVGSSFYIGSNEWMGKDLNNLTLTGKWMDFPSDLTTHYANYGESDLDTGSFKVAAEVLRNYEWTNLGSEHELFQEDDSNTSEAFQLNLVESSGDVLENDPLEVPVDEFSGDSETGFIRLRLSGPPMAFGHKKFPFVMQQQAILIAAQTNPDASLLPKQPYTPLLKDFSIQYGSEAESGYTSSEMSSYEANEVKLFQIFPFGQKEVHPALGSKKIRLAPEFLHKHEKQDMNHIGEFYIGIENLDAPQNLSLLIQVAEGSEDPTLPTTEVHWFYLVNDEWFEFETPEILADTTNGLLQSGVIQFAVPRAANLEHRILPSGLHWLKAAMGDNTAAVADLIDIHAQAVSATFEDRGNDPDHLKTALPAESASKLVNRLSAIKSLSQPYSSFGGRIKEEPQDFYRRVSERLRHKDRGVAIWDYERLVLEAFPELHKVKCINHSSYGYDNVLEKEFDSEFAPGYVTLVVVPDLNNKNSVNPYEPAVSKAKLEKIREYLEEVMPAFAHLKVLNPLYEQVKVEMEVEFREGFDRGFYEKQLNIDIKKLLAPWAFQEAEDILFGGKVYRSTIINYVEERPYVDYLKEFKMHHYVDKVLYKHDIVETYPTTARSIFVSISDKDPANEHIIKEIAKAC